MVPAAAVKSERAAPPSPALSHSDVNHGLPGILGDFGPHSTISPYTRAAHLNSEPYQTRSQSQPVTRYSTPVPQPMPYQHMTYVGSYPGYPQHVHLQEESPYGPFPDEMQAAPYSTPATSPPTPSRSSNVITTRSGASIVKGSPAKALAPRSTRVGKSSPKKKERARTTKRIPKLDRPMSELTKDCPVPTADIEAYVHRSAEERHREVAEGKVPGKIKRPMNAFMLYRKAYQNLAKDWCSQHNHQVVSQVCGDSWPLEPEHVRLQFNEWAKIERDNHQRAHPGYKFTPCKPQKQKYQKVRDEPEGSEEGDADWESRTGGTVSRDGSLTRTLVDESDGDYRPPRSAYQSHHTAGTAQNVRSTFGFNNPARPMPAPYDRADAAAHYYQATHGRSPLGQRLHGAVEDFSMRMTPPPGAGAYHPHRILAAEQSGFDFIGFPPHPAHAHMGPFVDQAVPHPMAVGAEQHIDPALLPVDGALFDQPLGAYMIADEMNQHQAVWGGCHLSTGADAGFADGLVGFDDSMLQEQMQFLRGNEDSWQIERLEPGHLDDWMDPQPTGT